MPEDTVPTSRPTALKVSLHAATVDRVVVVDLPGDLTAVRFGDADAAVEILGPVDDVHRLIIEADRQLAHLASRGRPVTEGG